MTKRRNGTLLKPLFRPRHGNICCTAGDARQVDVDPGYHAGFVFQRLLLWRAYSPGVHQGWRVLLLPSHSSRLGGLLRAALSRVTGEHTLAERLDIAEKYCMWLMDAQPYLLDNFTLTLPLTEELYCTVYHDQQTGFRLVLVRIGTSQPPYRLAEAADWEQFYGKVPALLKDTERWEEEKEVKHKRYSI